MSVGGRAILRFFITLLFLVPMIFTQRFATTVSLAKPLLRGSLRAPTWHETATWLGAGVSSAFAAAIDVNCGTTLGLGSAIAFTAIMVYERLRKAKIDKDHEARLKEIEAFVAMKDAELSVNEKAERLKLEHQRQWNEVNKEDLSKKLEAAQRLLADAHDQVQANTVEIHQLREFVESREARLIAVEKCRDRLHMELHEYEARLKASGAVIMRGTTEVVAEVQPGEPLSLIPKTTSPGASHDTSGDAHVKT